MTHTHPTTESERQALDDTLAREESDRLNHAVALAQMRQHSEDEKRELARAIAGTHGGGPPSTESEALGRAVDPGPEGASRASRMLAREVEEGHRAY